MQGFEPNLDDMDDNHSDPETMSLHGVGGGGMLPVDDDFVIGGGDDSKRVKQQSIVIGAIVTVVAFGAILGMRVLQPDMEAVGASEETRKWMATLPSRLSSLGQADADDPLNPDRVNSVFRDTDELIQLITNDQTLQQVPVAQVQMNPFLPVKKVVTEDAVDPHALAEAAREDKLIAVYDALDRIEVQSILGGDNPRAFIGGKIYQAGDVVAGLRIAAIEPRYIQFEADGLVPRAGERPLRAVIRTAG